LADTEVQTGLNFANSPPDLFAGREMGEDVLRVLRKRVKVRAGVMAEISDEISHVRAALKWAAPLAA
jgi:hypothetical protein